MGKEISVHNHAIPRERIIKIVRHAESCRHCSVAIVEAKHNIIAPVALGRHFKM